MGRLLNWIIGLILFGCVYAAAFWTLADVIGNDVQTRTQNDLNERGYDWIQVDVDGRDVTLKAGTQSPTKEITQAALHGVEEIWGVRVVHNEMDKPASEMSADASVTAPVATGNADNQKSIEITLPLLPVKQASEPEVQVKKEPPKQSSVQPPNPVATGNVGNQESIEIALPLLPVEQASEPEVQVKKEPPKQSSVQPPDKEVVKPVAVPAIISERVLKLDDQSKKQPDKQEVAKAAPVADKTLETRKETVQKTGPLTPGECQKQIDRIIDNNIILYGSASSKINKQSFGLLDKIAAIAKRCRTTRLEVAGHTDNTGTRRANIRLSRLRAESVMTYLIGRGVDPNKLVAQGFGSANPIANNANKKDRARNRRIEFNVRQ